MMDCQNTELYELTPKRRETGLESGEQVRHEVLWQYARGQADAGVRAHLAECKACADLAKIFSRMDLAIHRSDAVKLAVCPPAADLSVYQAGELPDGEQNRIARHLVVCDPCREEVAWLESTAIDRMEEPKVVEIPRRRWLVYAAVAAAVALLAVIPILRQPKTSKYADLAEAVVVDRADLIRTLSQPDLFRPVLEASLASYQSGDYTQAEAKAREILAAIPTDPSALFVMALAEHKRGNLGAAFQLMSQSERIEPKTEYRCWTALQFALMSGDRILIDRECRHMDGHERYQERARQILEQVRKRQASWERPGVGLRSS